MVTASKWLEIFAEAIVKKDGASVASLFVESGFWRDYLPFGWTLQTIEGRQDIAKFADATAEETRFGLIGFEGEPLDQEGFFKFQTKDGLGRGYVRIEDGLCSSLFTMLDTLETKKADTHSSKEPEVLLIGGGQSGLALGAQLDDLGVSYLIVDKYPKIGDQWRSRYESLVLHDPVWYDHMPFKPFPNDWPVFTPKDKMGDWLEAYADDLQLNCSTSTELVGATFNEAQNSWNVELQKNGDGFSVRSKQLVFALGISGFPNVPSINGQDDFKGMQMHSSAFKGGVEYEGKNVIIVGANNSAHDIASNLVNNGAKPIMIQRSSTLVVKQDDYCDKILGPLYSKEALKSGITTNKADILQASVPLRILEKKHKLIWDDIRQERKEYYSELTNAGFNIDFAEDGTGLGMKYRRTASGYYIDVGGAQMVADGKIGIRSACTVEKLLEEAVELSTGEKLKADAIIYATGFGDMTDWVAKYISKETAEAVGHCWGYGSNTKGDPGPWIGELRNMWVPTAQKGLWFMCGNLSQARFYSRLLALQLAK